MVDPKAHWASKAEELKGARKFEEAVKILDKVQKIEREEKDDDFWYKKSIHFCDIGEYRQAKDALEKDLERNQKSYNSYFLMGKILYSLNEFEESLECLNKASEEHDRLHLRNTHKVSQMKNVNKFEEAVKYSDLVYQEKTLGKDFWFQKGTVLFKLKKFEGASSCFKTALGKGQKDTEILYALAKSELWSGNKKSSFEILEKICNQQPLLKEKLRTDKDFGQVTQDKRFQSIVG